MEKKNNFFVISGLVLLVIIILVVVITISKPIDRTSQTPIDQGPQSGTQDITPNDQFDENLDDVNLDENMEEEVGVIEEEPTIVYDYSPSDIEGIPLMTDAEKELLNISTDMPIYVIERNSAGKPTRFRYLESKEDVDWVKERENPEVE